MAIQKLDLSSVFIVSNANSVMAEMALDADWTGVAQVDKDTWAAATSFGIKDLSGRYEFYAYFMGAFIANYNNVTKYLTTALGVGTDDTYANRATRTWATT